MSEFFNNIPKIAYEGKDSKNPLAFKFYNPDEVIAGKTMREQLKFALSWWERQPVPVTFCPINRKCIVLRYSSAGKPTQKMSGAPARLSIRKCT